jgi:hypothetical protein
VGREQDSRDTEREKGREIEHCSKRVLASAINLTVGQMFMTAKERIIGYFIKMDINIISKNLGGIIFMVLYFSALFTQTFHLTDKSPMCHNILCESRKKI